MHKCGQTLTLQYSLCGVCMPLPLEYSRGKHITSSLAALASGVSSLQTTCACSLFCSSLAALASGARSSLCWSGGPAPSQERKGLVSCLYMSCPSAYATLMDMLQRSSTWLASVTLGIAPINCMIVQMWRAWPTARLSVCMLSHLATLAPGVSSLRTVQAYFLFG